MSDNNKPLYFHVYKESGTVTVALLPFKGTNKYSYVNLTRGHICNCVFDSIEDAIADMDKRVENNELAYVCWEEYYENKENTK